MRIDAGETRKEIQRMYALLGKKNEDIFLMVNPIRRSKECRCKPDMQTYNREV